MPDRRKVRILQAHDDLADDDFHEWIERSEGVNDCEMRDTLGREGNKGWIRWDYWRCNNPDCNALALVSSMAVAELVTEWLDD